MISRLKESQIELTRTLIKDQFIHLYEKKGLDKVTVNEICKVCEISRSTFYQHFDDKYDLLETIENELLENIQHLNKDMQGIFIRDTKASLPNWVETATYIMEKKDYFRPLILTPGDPRFVHKWNKLIRESYRQRLESDNFMTKNPNQDIILYSMASATIGMYEFWLQYRPDLTPQEIAQNGTRLLWSSFYKLEHFD